MGQLSRFALVTTNPSAHDLCQYLGGSRLHPRDDFPRHFVGTPRVPVDFGRASQVTPLEILLLLVLIFILGYGIGKLKE